VNPFNFTERPLNLVEDRTIKGYGKRGHGLNGKDADLTPHGQLAVLEAFWFEDGTVRAKANAYATYCPDEERLDDDDYMALCHAVVICAPGTVEWSGDDWCGGEEVTVEFTLDWDDNLDDDANIAAACRALYDAFEKANEDFETAVAAVHDAWPD
jgi:hypothetical protein